jgi:hypothetical protein
MTKTRAALPLALLLAGCSSPAAPSPDLEAVIIFEHRDFKGAWKALSDHVRDLEDIDEGCYHSDDALHFDDCVSSIRIPEGWRVTIFEDPRFQGARTILMADETDFRNLAGPCGRDFDDCVSSIRIFPPGSPTIP